MVKILERTIPKNILAQVGFKYKRIDIIGDIAVIKVHPKLEEYRHKIANEVLKEIPYVKVVLRQISPTETAYRIKKYEWLAGEKRTWTLVKEHGCTFKVDIAKVFYTPRLAYEHMRIVKMVKDGEEVLNMFAGIGCFSILIAKYANPKVVYSIDINPKAIELMRENTKLNRVEDKIVIFKGDAANVILRNILFKVDRVLMPLPMLALKYLPYAILALKEEGGYIHMYLDVYVDKGEKAVVKAKHYVQMALTQLPVKYRILNGRVVRSVGPRRKQVVLDVWARRVNIFEYLQCS